PALLRDRFEPPHVHRALTAWATFQGLAAFIGFTVGTFVVPEFGWRPMWIGAACITLLLIPFVIFLVPKDPAGSVGDAAASGATKTWQLVRVTISRPGPWLAGAIFACYSIQWMAVLGFSRVSMSSTGSSNRAQGSCPRSWAGPTSSVPWGLACWRTRA
ncbi:MFS transporter, partial [Pseudoglutamicibacter albus]|uniref:MFS transporter n=1 Tax=Pseudoglutamicibacter albus TaxID=98671 RepID=UPI0036184C82